MDLAEIVGYKYINSGRYDTKEDFSVVIQPLTEEVIFPEKVTASGKRITDFDCLSTDCFHFSQKCQARDIQYRPSHHLSKARAHTIWLLECATNPSVLMNTRGGSIVPFTPTCLLAVSTCHYTALAHAATEAAANALWNNLLEPVGNKSKNWPDPFSIFLCPTEERPYFFTKKNNPI
uniref:Uncharacterized protein n=1 Tax=Timema genevievae TaxID=629358 RepID=A0A7R9JUC1_TIMGE|nr:unnamed protein product [Timema genevievae]